MVEIQYMFIKLLHNKNKDLGLFYVVLSILFMQGIPLHVHTYDHGPETSDHSHFEEVHFLHDFSEEEHADAEHADKVVEVDLSHPGLLKNFSNKTHLIVFITAVILSLCPIPPAVFLWRRNTRALGNTYSCLLPSPRAPPL